MVTDQNASFIPLRDRNSVRREQLTEAVAPLYFSTGIAAVLMLAAWATWPELYEMGLTASFLLIILYPVYKVSEKHFLVQSWALICVWTAMGAASISWKMVNLNGLLIFPVLLAALILGRNAGFLTAIMATSVLIIVSNMAIEQATQVYFPTILFIWGGLAFVWLLEHPIDQMGEWLWQNYRSTKSELEKSRDAVVELSQVVKELANAELQMRHLNKLLDQERKAAQQAEEAKAEFVAKVSHELRTPLNMIIGYTEIMTGSPESYGWVPDGLIKDLQIVIRNSRHLSGLIDDILDLSQIEAGQMALAKEEVNFQEVVDSAINAVRPLFDAKKLVLNVHIPSELPIIYCDPLRIREVLINLLSNAGRFTEIGGVTIRVSAANQVLTISVADTGPGISSQDQTRLFKPFEQVDNSIRRRYGGTGLGLAISKGFIEQHDGRMWVESDGTPGHGTTFSFCLPIFPISQPENGMHRWISPYHDFSEVPAHLRIRRPVLTSRILVLEQGKTLSRILLRYLTDTEVEAVPDISHAQAELSEKTYHLLVVNHSAPEVAFQQVKDLYYSNRLPNEIPVMICNIPDPEEILQTLGSVDHLVKPVSQEQLFSALDHLNMPIQRILLVDDDPDALQLYTRMIKRSGRDLEIFLAGNGEEAIKHIDGGLTPDVILLDLMMPGMNGYKFLDVRKTVQKLSNIPVIIVSAQDLNNRPLRSQSLMITSEEGYSIQQIIEFIKTNKNLLPLGVEYEAQAGREELIKPPG